MCLRENKTFYWLAIVISLKATSLVLFMMRYVCYVNITSPRVIND